MPLFAHWQFAPSGMTIVLCVVKVTARAGFGLNFGACYYFGNTNVTNRAAPRMAGRFTLNAGGKVGAGPASWSIWRGCGPP